ncbi:MAG: methylmalonyl-CoA mutase family protein [bacterium]|nr:methylmalonyl-CoA mutase family protein [bacterium]
MSDMLNQARKQWEDKELAKVTAKAPLNPKGALTDSLIEMPILATPADVYGDAVDGVVENTYLDKVGFPGRYPFTRGPYSTMHRGRPWTMRQYAGFGSAAQTNARWKKLLELGQTGLSTAFDLPTQLGLDSDNPECLGEVGRTGVAVDSLADMERLFDGIPMGKTSTSMTINAPTITILAMFVAVAEKQGVPVAELRGTVQNDILKEYAARKAFIFPVEPSMRLTVDVCEWATKHMPHFNTISISGYHIREAGSTAPQEIAFTLSNAIAYMDAARARGLDLAEFARPLSFFFQANVDLFEEVAKFRAARRMWARIVKERFGIADPKSQLLRFHTQTGGSTLQAQEIDNNIVRTAISALAAVMGGTQSLHTNSRDEALSLPSEISARTALRSQQIIAYESGVTRSIDPLAGSYLVEWLTDRIEAEAHTKDHEIDRRGGSVQAIRTGWMQREIENSAYQFQKRVDSGERKLVGVEPGRDPDPIDKSGYKFDPQWEVDQVRRLKDLRAKRDNAAVTKHLAQITDAARGADNLMPCVIDAVKAYATEGEITAAMERVFGRHQE